MPKYNKDIRDNRIENQNILFLSGMGKKWDWHIVRNLFMRYKHGCLDSFF